MNLRNLFRVSAAIFMISGLIWLLAPQASTASYGLDNVPFAGYLVQILGTFNIALAVLAFSASRMAPSANQNAVVTTILVQQALSAIVNLLSVLNGAIPGGAGWFGVAFNIVFVLAYCYFGFIRLERTAAAELQS